jgi:hypothetical protein
VRPLRRKTASPTDREQAPGPRVKNTSVNGKTASATDWEQTCFPTDVSTLVNLKMASPTDGEQTCFPMEVSTSVNLKTARATDRALSTQLAGPSSDLGYLQMAYLLNSRSPRVVQRCQHGPRDAAVIRSPAGFRSEPSGRAKPLHQPPLMLTHDGWVNGGCQPTPPRRKLATKRLDYSEMNPLHHCVRPLVSIS